VLNPTSTTPRQQIVSVPIESIQPHPRNSRKGNVALIRASLEAHDQYQPILCQASTGLIIAGAHRWKAAVDLGWAEMDAILLDVSDDQALRIMLMDNKSSDEASYDDRLLAELLGEMQRSEDWSGTGWNPEDLDALEAQIRAAEPLPEPDTDPDEVPPLPAEPVTEVGDVWHLGPHRLLCGDARSREDVTRLLDGTVADLILTDPPYCSGGFQESGKSQGSVGTNVAHKQIANDRLSTRGYIALVKAAISAAPAAYVYVFTDWRMWVYLFDVVESSGYGVRSMIVWDKSSPGMGHGWRSQHELIMWGAKTTPPIDKYAAGQGNVIQAARTGNPLHTTQKPVDLLVRLLDATPFAATVYDPFAGSGSILIACHETERTCYAMELDPAYCDVICRRFQTLTGTVPQRVEDGRPVEYDFR
jgi:DNA modification methylase